MILPRNLGFFAVNWPVQPHAPGHRNSCLIRSFALLLALMLEIGLTTIGRPAAAAQRYENGFPGDASFFPIGVWVQQPDKAASFKAIGINTYVGLWTGPTEAQLGELDGQGMYLVADQNEIGLNSAHRGMIKAWLVQPDEPDNGQRVGLGRLLRRLGPCVPAAEVAQRSHVLKARDPSRPVMVNFGPGVADPSWHGRGTCAGDLGYYHIASQGTDILSFDIYPVGSDTPHVKGKLEYVAKGVANLVKEARPGQAVWSFVETTALDPERPVTPAELRAEVWMALIHGARGIVYFVHEWAGGLRKDGIFRHPEVVDEVRRTDALIGSLALVLNAPEFDQPVTVSSPVPIATMAKQQDDVLYVFAVAMRNQSCSASLTVPGVKDAVATVLDEMRTVGIHDGGFADTFAGYAVHLYKIPLQQGQP
jgi:hypothetical protein